MRIVLASLRVRFEQYWHRRLRMRVRGDIQICPALHSIFLVEVFKVIYRSQITVVDCSAHAKFWYSGSDVVVPRNVATLVLSRTIPKQVSDLLGFPQHHLQREFQGHSCLSGQQEGISTGTSSFAFLPSMVMTGVRDFHLACLGRTAFLRSRACCKCRLQLHQFLLKFQRIRYILEGVP